MEIQELKLEQIPFFRICFCFGLGILVSFQIHWNYAYFQGLALLILMLFVLLLLFWVRKKSRNLYYLIYVLLFLLGVLSLAIKMPKEKVDLSKTLIYSGKLLEEPSRKGQVLRSKLELNFQHLPSGPKPKSILVMATIWDKDSSIVHLHKGDIIGFRTKIKELDPAFNPGQFDYSKYLNGKGIFYQVFIPKDQLLRLKIAKINRFESWVLQYQERLQMNFRKFINDPSAFQIASAITFGYRSDMADELMEVFSNTGTIHVLSVSGMHVGLMFLLLTWILKPIDRLAHGRKARYLLILCFIWFYALICGFVPAVLRATLMFSLYMIGHWRARVVLSLNTVFSSAFLLLVFDPFMLLDIGFQLSYLAVIGILLFIPVLQGLYYTSHIWINKLLDLLYISIAAQLSTTALAIFYFQQFPTFFLFSNLFISLPSTVILYLGMGLVVFSMEGIGEILGNLLNECILFSYQILKYIDSIPFSSINGMVIDAKVTFLCYLGLAFLFIGFQKQAKIFLCTSVISFVMLFSMILKIRLDHRSFQGVKIYNTRKELSIAYINRADVLLLSTCDSLQHKSLRFSVLPDLKKYVDPKDIQFASLKVKDENQCLHLYDDMDLYIQNTQVHDHQASKILLLRKNAQLPNELNASMCILDGSNSDWYIEQTVAELKRVNRAYYILKDNFAYVWESNQDGKNELIHIKGVLGIR